MTILRTLIRSGLMTAIAAVGAAFLLSYVGPCAIDAGCPTHEAR